MVTISFKDNDIKTVERKRTSEEIYAKLLSYLKAFYIKGKITHEQYKSCKGEFRRCLCKHFYTRSESVDFKNGSSKGAYNFLSKNIPMFDAYYKVIINEKVLYAELTSKYIPFVFIEDNKLGSVTIKEN